MKTIVVEVSTGYVGSRKTMEIEIEDEATEEEMQEEAVICLWEMIDFNWYVKETK